MDIKITTYIQKQPIPQREILALLRKIILKAVPKIHEEIKMGVSWYECKFYLVGLKNHINMGFAYHFLLEKHQDKLEDKGKYMRHLKFFSLEDINEKKLINLIKATKTGYSTNQACLGPKSTTT